MQPTIATDDFQDMHAADVRHHDVEHDDVRTFAANQVDGSAGIAGADDVGVACVAQAFLHDPDVERFVIQDEDLGEFDLVVRTQQRFRGRNDCRREIDARHLSFHGNPRQNIAR